MKVRFCRIGRSRIQFQSLSMFMDFNLDFLTEAAKILNTFKERYTELLKSKPDSRSNEVNLIESFQYKGPILCNAYLNIHY
jgi:tRNA splicing ligase